MGRGDEASLTILGAVLRGGQRAFRAAVTLDGTRDFFQPQAFSGGNGGGYVELIGNRGATYEELYRTQVWVAAAVNRYARSISRLPLKTYRDPGRPGERERTRETLLARLLASPAPRMSPAEWKAAVVHNLMIHGNCVCVKLRARPGAPPYALAPSSFAYWTVERDDSGEITYLFSPGTGRRLRFLADDVVHFRWWGVGANLRGVSPLDSLRTTLMTEDATQRMVIASFEKGTRPSGAFSVDGTLNPQARAEARAMLNELYAGVDNTGTLALLDRGAKWQPMSHNLVDSDVVKLRQLDRDEVAAAYNIPASSIGILDRATFSNITEQHLGEYVDSIQPVTTLLEETLAVQVIAGEPLFEGEYCEFDFNAVLQGDPVKATDVLTRAVGGPFMTVNEGRARMNLEPLDDPEMDKVLIPLNMSGGGQSRDGNA